MKLQLCWADQQSLIIFRGFAIDPQIKWRQKGNGESSMFVENVNFSYLIRLNSASNIR